VGDRGDYLIVGSGIAALRAALELAEGGDVLVLTKADSTEGSTGYAQGGIAAAVGKNDSPALHLADSLAAGDGLCDEAAVRVLVEQGPGDVSELMSWGVAFDRRPNGAISLAHEAAHSVRRVLHARDATGREIGRVLWERAAGHPRIQVLEHARALSILLAEGRAVGVRYQGPDGRVREGRAGSTLLATGGAGQVFSETTNPQVASGDGVAMAWLAGARVADLEFVQFHPTALHVEGQPRFLLSEALRGEGARLVNDDDEAFMTSYERAGDLAPRDRVSRAIVREMARTGRPVYLSLRHLEPSMVHDRFPLISAACASAGLDLACDRIPVSPAAHYLMGGVETDLDGRTSVPDLYAAGEVACTGVHGANRLASNSLLEGLVFGRRAGVAMHADRAVREWPAAFTTTLDVGPSRADGDGPDDEIQPDEASVRARMWQHVGVLRHREGLDAAVSQLDRAWCWFERRGDQALIDQPRRASHVIVGRLMARAALRREESRGGHFRSDFPARDDPRWQRRVADRRVVAGLHARGSPAGRDVPAARSL
jgi:L-aspartate oxidase